MSDRHEPNTVIERTALILSVVGASRFGLNGRQIGIQAGVSTATAYRTANTLTAWRYLELVEGDCYILGPALDDRAAQRARQLAATRPDPGATD